MTSFNPTDDEKQSRLRRFADFYSTKSSAPSPAKSQLAGLYDGSVVDNRMDMLRSQIEYIRSNWHRYAEFNSELRAYLLNEYHGKEQIEFNNVVQEICGKEKSWLEQSIDYGVLKAYASTFGFREVFSISSKALRDDALITDLKAVRSNVFLTELLNIDLFRFHEGKEQARNFSGTVYRGLAVTAQELQQFKELITKDIRHRVLAIPLATMSATQDLAVIMNLFNTFDAGDKQKDHLVLLRVHVESLDAKLLELYHAHFPSSVVTSLCAMPIYELSPFPDEGEVILRGPWFQLLRLGEEQIENIAIHVMDVVMISSNRDHPSTMALNEKDYGLARDLFRSINWISRCTKCKALAEEYGMVDDALLFGQVIDEEKLKSDICLEKITAGK